MQYKVRKKHFKKMQKYVGMTMPKSIQTRWYIGMAVCKGRGDDIKHKVKRT